MKLEPNFQTLAQNFLEDLGKTAKVSTLKTYSSLLSRHILPQIGHINPISVGNATLKNLVNTLKTEGLKPSTIQSAVTLVKLVMASATTEEGEQVYMRVWNNKFIDAPEIKARDQKAPTIGAKALSEAISRDLRQDQVLWALLAGSGLRIGEALALLDNVDNGKDSFWSTDDQSITIRSTVVRGKVQYSPKTDAGYRTVDISTELNNYLASSLKIRGGFLFQSEKDSIYRTMTAYKHLLASGIPGFHSLRRFRITHLRKAGVPEGLIQFWAGHAKKSITDRYDKISEDIETRRDWAEKAGLGFKLRAQ